MTEFKAMLKEKNAYRPAVNKEDTVHYLLQIFHKKLKFTN